MLVPLSTCVLAVATLWLADSCGAPARSAPRDSASPAVSEEQRPSFTRLLAQNTSGYPEPAELVLRDRGALESAWRTLFAGNQGTPLPTVDFARSTLVLLAVGEKNSGGHAVRVDRVTRQGTTAVIHYTVTQPGPGCMTTMMITSPVELVSIPRVPGQVHFDKSTVIERC